MRDEYKLIAGSAAVGLMYAGKALLFAYIWDYLNDGMVDAANEHWHWYSVFTNIPTAGVAIILERPVAIGVLITALTGGIHYSQYK